MVEQGEKPRSKLLMEDMLPGEIEDHIKELKKAIPGIKEEPLIECEFAPLVARSNILTFEYIKAVSVKVVELEQFLHDNVTKMIADEMKKLKASVREDINAAIKSTRPKGFLGALSILTHASLPGAIAFTALCICGMILQLEGHNFFFWIK